MESKYYTPDISEFHVGFKYQVLSLESDLEACVYKWNEEVFTENSNILGYIQDIKVNKIRVKYLDKDDIESLGFSETTTKQFIKNAPGSLPYWTQVVIDFRWPEDITIIGKRGEEVGMLFRGAVRNISELKKVLKMVTYDLS